MMSTYTSSICENVATETLKDDLAQTNSDIVDNATSMSGDISSDKTDFNNRIESSEDDELRLDPDRVVVPPESPVTSTKWYYSIKLYICILLVGFIIFVIVDSVTNKYIRNGLTSFLEWIEDNTISGFFLFVIVYVVATLLFIPGSLLTFGAGFVFSMSSGLGIGIVIGTVSVFLGASIGAVLAFLLGRYLFLEQVRKLSKKYATFEALNAALQTNGLKIMILLRLSPIIPFSALNYLAGALTISTRDYIVSMFAILPGTILYVFVGASAGSLADSSNNSMMSPTVTIIVVTVGIVLGILAIWLTARYARKELNRIVEERRISNSNQTNISDLETGTAEENIPVEESAPENSNDMSRERKSEARQPAQENDL